MQRICLVWAFRLCLFGAGSMAAGFHLLFCKWMFCWYIASIPGTCRGQKRTLEPLRLELQNVVNHHDWKSNLGPLQEQQVLLTANPSPPSLFLILKLWDVSWICASSLRRAHANLLCIVPVLVYVLLKLVSSHHGADQMYAWRLTVFYLKLIFIFVLCPQGWWVLADIYSWKECI